MKTQRETSDVVCQKLLSKLPITDGIRIWEPSIGEGKIIKFMFDNYNLGGVTVIGSELNKERIKKAEENLSDAVINRPKGIIYDQRPNAVHLFQEDFLKNGEMPSAHIKPDIFVACPPFKNNIDLEHIKLMFELLKHKGMLASLTSPYWVTNNEPHQVEFRKWLENKEYQLTMLPDNSFIEKDKTVPTGIITIYKR